MDPALMVGLKQQYDSLSNDGFRVLAVATKDLPGKDVCSLADERDLVLRGYVAFLDPPKKTAGPALEALHRHGVAVKILTGDNQLISRKVCKDVGLAPDPMLLGADVEKMSDAGVGRGGIEDDPLCPPLPGSQGARHPCPPR
jgi:Mg2+-importing ATPase